MAEDQFPKLYQGNTQKKREYQAANQSAAAEIFRKSGRRDELLSETAAKIKRASKKIHHPKISSPLERGRYHLISLKAPQQIGGRSFQGQIQNLISWCGLAAFLFNGSTDSAECSWYGSGGPENCGLLEVREPVASWFPLVGQKNKRLLHGKARMQVKPLCIFYRLKQ